MFKIYSTTTCAYCNMVKKLFVLKEKDYEEVNLDENPDLREMVTQLSGVSTVPVVTKVEDGKEILVSVGWRPADLMKAL